MGVGEANSNGKEEKDPSERSRRSAIRYKNDAFSSYGRLLLIRVANSDAMFSGSKLLPLRVGDPGLLGLFFRRDV